MTLSIRLVCFILAIVCFLIAAFRAFLFQNSRIGKIDFFPLAFAFAFIAFLSG